MLKNLLQIFKYVHISHITYYIRIFVLNFIVYEMISENLFHVVYYYIISI